MFRFFEHVCSDWQAFVIANCYGSRRLPDHSCGSPYDSNDCGQRPAIGDDRRVIVEHIWIEKIY